MAVSVEPGIDKATFFKEVGYEPHSEEQWDFHNDDHRFKVACCGRRWGKTTAAGKELGAAMFVPDSYYWIVGPKYVTGEKEFRVVYNDLMTKCKLKKFCKTRYNVEQGQMRIETPWNSILEVKSAERKDTLLGEGLKGAIMSEAARHDRDTWEQYVRPALADYRGFALFPSTPTGFNWYFGLWQVGQGFANEYKSWRFPAWTNPVVYPGGRDDPEIVAIENEVSAAFFAQEIGAEFTSIHGSIYEEWNENIHVKDITYNPEWKNYWTFDYGFAAPFVCLDIMVDPHDNVYVWREYQVKSKTTGEHAQILRARQSPEGFHVDGAYGDPHGANESATLAQSLIGVQSNDVSWDVGVEYVKRWLKIQADGKPKLFVDKSCTELRRQMQMLRKPPEKEGKPLSPKPQWDYDDHGPDALRYFFGQHFFLGANSHLTDLYDPAYVGSEAHSFFTYHANMTRDQSFGTKATKPDY